MKTITIDGVEYSLTPVAQPEKPSSRRWRAEKDRTYYKIDSELAIVSHYECHLKVNNKHYNSGNYYKTEKEATQARDKQIAIVRVTDKLREIEAEEGWVCDWGSSEQLKYIFRYSHVTGQVEAHSILRLEFPVFGLCSSSSAIDYAIEHMQDDLRLFFS